MLGSFGTLDACRLGSRVVRDGVTPQLPHGTARRAQLGRFSALGRYLGPGTATLVCAVAAGLLPSGFYLGFPVLKAVSESVAKNIQL